MTRFLDRSYRFAFVAAALMGLAFVPISLSAQSELASSEAEAFMGEWDVALQTQMGPMNLDLVIEDQGGMVAANLGSPELGGSQEITDIARESENLVMSYSMDAQGQIVPVTVTLTPSGDELETSMDFADGMFVATGTATRADG